MGRGHQDQAEIANGFQGILMSPGIADTQKAGTETSECECALDMWQESWALRLRRNHPTHVKGGRGWASAVGRRHRSRRGGSSRVCYVRVHLTPTHCQLLLPGGCLAPGLQRVQCDPPGLGGFCVLTSRLQGLLFRRPWQGAFASRSGHGAVLEGRRGWRLCGR